MKKRVAIIMGSKTDYEVMKKAADMLEHFHIPYDVKIVSAHRTPDKMVRFANQATKKYCAIIAGAGAAAHLPGMVAAMTTLPVIGVPVTVGTLKGLDALLSIAQMPKGIPVATVAIDNADNAGLLAARMIGAFDSKVRSQLEKWQKDQAEKVRQMNQSLKKEKKRVKKLQP